MFYFYNAPRVNYNYYRPTIYRQRYVPIESYLLNSLRQAQEYENLKTLFYKSLIQQKKDQASKEENEKKPNEDDIKNENKEEQKQKQNPFYYFESHSTFDGEKIIEEQKVQKIDSEGKVHHSLKRRLGDQWYQTEKIEDSEGKATNKEIWHNVPEDEIENFKQEWINKSHFKPALSHKNEEEGIEENNNEIKNEKESEAIDNEENKNQPELTNQENEIASSEKIDNNKIENESNDNEN